MRHARRINSLDGSEELEWDRRDFMAVAQPPPLLYLSWAWVLAASPSLPRPP